MFVLIILQTKAVIIEQIYEHIKGIYSGLLTYLEYRGKGRLAADHVIMQNAAAILYQYSKCFLSPLHAV